MECQLPLLLLLAFIPAILAQNATEARIVVDGTTAIAETDENFVCLTMDMWPRDKCSWDHCVWGGQSSVLNTDLSLPLLAKTVQAFNPLRIRIGGTLQDTLIYDIGSFKGHCYPYRVDNNQLFGYTKGCLYMERWDELNHFFNKTGAIVTFGLNALLGRYKKEGHQWAGDWDSSNAEALIEYTIQKKYQIHSWEFGNELSGNGIGASVSAEQYAKDLIKLREMIDRLYENSERKPLLIAPGGFFDAWWYDELIQKTGPGVVNVLTHHIYNLGAGKDPNLIYRIMDPNYLSQISKTFKELENIIQKHGPWSDAWVGEAGGAYNSGGYHISDAFVGSYWFLDQLGMAAVYKTKVYCRQALIGGFYGVLNTTTLIPTPDYYSALLFHRLMGPQVLNVENNVSPYLRTYAHCSRDRPGVTLLFINLSNQTDFTIQVENHMNMTIHKSNTRRVGSFFASPMPSPKEEVSSLREEYHLTPRDAILRSTTMLLNGNPLEITEEGELPNLTAVYHRNDSPIYIATSSIAFIVIPNFEAPACT